MSGPQLPAKHESLGHVEVQVRPSPGERSRRFSPRTATSESRVVGANVAADVFHVFVILIAKSSPSGGRGGEMMSILCRRKFAYH